MSPSLKPALRASINLAVAISPLCSAIERANFTAIAAFASWLLPARLAWDFVGAQTCFLPKAVCAETQYSARILLCDGESDTFTSKRRVCAFVSDAVEAQERAQSGW